VVLCLEQKHSNKVVDVVAVVAAAFYGIVAGDRLVEQPKRELLLAVLLDAVVLQQGNDSGGSNVLLCFKIIQKIARQNEPPPLPVSRNSMTSIFGEPTSVFHDRLQGSDADVIVTSNFL